MVRATSPAPQQASRSAWLGRGWVRYKREGPFPVPRHGSSLSTCLDPLESSREICLSGWGKFLLLVMLVLAGGAGLCHSQMGCTHLALPLYGGGVQYNSSSSWETLWSVTWLPSGG